MKLNMRMGGMLGDIWHSLFKAPITERYPFVRRAAPVQLRSEASRTARPALWS